MSVINKMLRDLDARRTAPSVGDGLGGWSGAWSGTHTMARHARMTLQGTLAQAAPLLSLRPVWLISLAMLCTLGVVASNWPGSTDRTLHWSLESAPQVSSVAPPVQVAQPLLIEPQEEVLEATRTHGRPPWPMSSALMLKLSASLPMTLPVSMTRDARSPEQGGALPQLASGGMSAPEASSQGGSSRPAEQAPALLSKAGAQKHAPGNLTASSAASAGTGMAVTMPSAVNAPANVTSHAQFNVASHAPSNVTTGTTAAASTPIQVNRQPAMQENLQQAQQLWHAGSREAAHELLRSTLQAAEQGDMNAPDAQAVLREWARMALAQDRAAEVMAVIKRHATHLAQQPETWALKGQAAQRLGLHAEAIEAYTHALNLRPHEVRWLLASAVSMAAAGQTEQAARLVAKARAQGPINPQITAYLKQAGVAVP